MKFIYDGRWFRFQLEFLPALTIRRMGSSARSFVSRRRILRELNLKFQESR